MQTKKVGTFITGFLVGLVVVYAYGQMFNNKVDNSPVVESANDNINTEVSISPDPIINNELSIVAQSAGNSVLINSITMPEDGWIVVHEIKDNIISNALGAARRDAGQYTDISVYLLRDTQPDNEYMVVLYKDNGDKTFDLSADKPFANADGEHVMSKFIAQ